MDYLSYMTYAMIAALQAGDPHPGTVVEMAEATLTRMRIFDQVREAARNWDGKDPIQLNWPQG